MTAPEISQDDLLSFHASHFLGISVGHFSEHFLGPVEEEEDQDDGLGYYDDGVKRTLTDEQIAMFRHSEIQAILRERRHKKEAETNSGLMPFVEQNGDVIEDGEVEDEELYESTIGVTQPAATSSRQSRKKKRKKSKIKGAQVNQPAKPDLRKRTWDKVDEGLAGLDYDEAANVADASQRLHTQRRRISYNDD